MDVAEAALAAREKLNPANAAGRNAEEFTRIPMSLPQQRLACPPIPGYQTYWMRGTPERLQQALNAGYEFVGPKEAHLNNKDLGGDVSKSGNTDLGSRVSTLATHSGLGEVGADGQPVRLYLMKQKDEWYFADQKLGEQRNAAVATALTAGFRQGMIGGKAPGELDEDASQRYVDPARSKIPELFKPKPQRR